MSDPAPSPSHAYSHDGTDQPATCGFILDVHDGLTEVCGEPKDAPVHRLAETAEINITGRAPRLLHPKCSPPGWWARRRLHIQEGDEWTCPICGIRSEWRSNDFGSIFWQTHFRDCGKSLVVHHGHPVIPGYHSEAEVAELERLRDRFQVPR